MNKYEDHNYIEDESDSSTKSRGLSDEIQRAIIESIVSPDKHLKFQQVCNEDNRLFGAPGSNLRLKVQQKHKRLLRLLRKDSRKFEKSIKPFIEQEQISYQVEVLQKKEKIMSKQFLAGGSK